MSVNELREQYQVGTKVRCLHMEDPYHPVPAGTCGKVIHVDDEGQIHVQWTTGSSLALVPDVDDFEIVYDPVEMDKKNPEQILQSLPKKEWRVLQMRYGLVDGVSHSVSDVAEEFAMTGERVLQIEKNAIRLMNVAAVSGN